MLSVASATAAALALALLVAPAPDSPQPGDRASAREGASAFTDAPDDVSELGYLDLRRVRVTNTAKRIRVTYTTRSAGNRRGAETLWLDTTPKRPGPELEVGFGRYSEGWVMPLRRWKRDTSKAARRKWSPDYTRVGRCDRTVRTDSRWEHGFTPVTITIRKKPGCITTARARVHLHTTTDAFDGGSDSEYDRWPSRVRDDLPNGDRSFTAWVTRRGTGTPSPPPPGPQRAVGSGTFTDGPDPVRWWSDLLEVSAQHTPTSLDLEIRHRVKPTGQYGLFETFLDVDADAVPDWRVDVVDAGGGKYLSRVTSWSRDEVWEPEQCAVDGLMTPHGSSRAWFSLPTSCLGQPAEIRIAVRSQDFTNGGPRPVDWLGAPEEWYVLPYGDPVARSALPPVADGSP
ncbi:hypothetical protein [Nocardioides ferulae]|uniref:hypothetical protein n=1 Tax=Nocardioides ferulae TaxID=2340821 RepID=UPI000EAFBC45|nr:hypothetical protein [Nocardioides ferulae]